MITITDKIYAYKKSIENKRVSVCGIGVSNLPLIDFLLSANAVVTARDVKSRSALGSLADELEAKGVRLVLGENYLDNIDDEIIFRTPGIRFDNPGFVSAAANGAVLTSEMQIFFELCPCKIIGITGSDGKTTTTTVISKILEADGKRVWLGGNIGAPLLPNVEKMKSDDIAVVELSSFQLHTMTRSPYIAVITNISPNHLDYHIDYNEYIDAKRNVYLHNSCSVLVTNQDNEITSRIAKDFSKTKRLFSITGKSDVCLQDGKIYAMGEHILNTSDILLPGRHNVENYMAAIGALYGIVSAGSVRKVATSFGGVEHRLEFVAEKNGVKYYNSSIDSSPTRTMAALNSFDERNVIVICGGYDKNLDYAPLAPVIAKKTKRVILTGDCAPKIKQALLDCPEFISSKTVLQEESDFEKAVLKASEEAIMGDVVLLSPAAASFDRFKNFEVRGRFFKNIVQNIAEG